MRLHKKGYRVSPNPGYGTPNVDKFKNKDGLTIVNVYNKNDLVELKKEEHGVVVGSSVGGRKRVEILKEAIAKQIKILNVRDTQKEVEKIEQTIASKKKAKELTKKKKSSKLEERKKKAAEKEKEESKAKEDEDSEDKKVKEKKDIDKILTTKEN